MAFFIPYAVIPFPKRKDILKENNRKALNYFKEKLKERIER